MNCNTVEELLLDFIEGELDPAQAQTIRAHLESCSKCRDNVDETRQLIDAMEVARHRQDQASRISDTSQSRAIPVTLSGGSLNWRTGQVLGDFEIISEAGRGGMGVVYRARQVSLNRIVALKVLPPSVCQTEKAVARFKREAKAAAKLHHTNIVSVYAQGQQDGHSYYAMELIEGDSLDQILKRSPAMVAPMGPDDEPAAENNDDTPSLSGAFLLASNSLILADYRKTALLIAGVAEGIEHAHKHGVIHRDIKPQNLLLGNDGQLHITDFGLARLLDEPSVTVTGEMLGTPAYMSREQVTADGKRIDHRTDIYSLGVTFYELLTGQRPFMGSSREQVIARICADEPRPPRKLNPAIPVDLDTICLRAMEKDPKRRYQRAKEMAADLRRYAQDRPILSRRVNPFEKALKWVRRHPAMTAIIVLSVTLAITASIWTFQAIKARHTHARSLVQQAFDTLAYVDYREPDQAIQWLAQAEPLAPDTPSFRFEFLKTSGLAHLLSNPKIACDKLSEAARLRPDDTEIMYLLAWALRRDERIEQSRQWIDKAASTQEGETTAAGHFFHAQAVVRHKPEEAEQAYDRAISGRDRYIQAMVHWARADNHWMYHHRKHERFSRQESFLSAACEFQRAKAYPRYLLSIAYRLSAEIYEQATGAEMAEQRYKRALALARDAQKVEPHSPLGYACEAEYWESRRDYAVALATRDRGAKYCSSPSSKVELCQYRWRLCYWLDQLPRAMADLETLKETSPNSDKRTMWYKWLFPALIRADMGDMEEALRLTREMVETHPTDFRAITSAACMLRLLGQADEANTLLAEQSEQLDYGLGATTPFPPGWVESLYAFCQGSKTMADLEALADDRASDTLLWPVAHFCAGTTALSKGDRPAALDHFLKCERTFDYDDYCYLAKIFARKLAKTPAWPAWIAPAVQPASPNSGNAGPEFAVP